MYDIVLTFFIYALLGWIYETMLERILRNTFTNRGFLFGPFLPVYGYGALLLLGLWELITGYFGTATNAVMLYMASSMTAATVLEYITGSLLMKVFHRRWWNYSGLPLNIHGHIAPRISIIWGLVSLMLVYHMHPYLSDMLLILPQTYYRAVSVILSGYMVFDTVISVSRHLKGHEKVSELIQNYLVG